MTHSNFATNNKLGLALRESSRQSILPVICGGNGNIKGFMTITPTTFTGTETTFTLSDGPVPIKSVTLPQKVNDGSGYGVGQYMAVIYPDAVERKAPWLGYSAFVNSNEIGYVMRHYMPTQGQMTKLDRGILITNLTVHMDELSYSSPTTSPPTVVNGIIRWNAAMNLNSAQMLCGFFDFNWVALFQAKASKDTVPLRIEIVSNPVGGAFKSTLVPYPAVLPLGGIEFNTIRIIKLLDVAAGTYTFTYKVIDDKNLSTTCELTLTIV